MEKLTYTNINGYLIPNLTYKSGEQMEQLGKYGFLRRDYLKNHRNSTYQVMLLQETIGEHLLEVDKLAREREEVNLMLGGILYNCCEQSRAVVCYQASSIVSGSANRTLVLEPCFAAFFVCAIAEAP